VGCPSYRIDLQPYQGSELAYLTPPSLYPTHPTLSPIPPMLPIYPTCAGPPRRSFHSLSTYSYHSPLGDRELFVCSSRAHPSRHTTGESAVIYTTSVISKSRRPLVLVSAYSPPSSGIDQIITLFTYLTHFHRSLPRVSQYDRSIPPGYGSRGSIFIQVSPRLRFENPLLYPIPLPSVWDPRDTNPICLDLLHLLTCSLS
jgi:hypothetical protein